LKKLIIELIIFSLTDFKIFIKKLFCFFYLIASSNWKSSNANDYLLAFKTTNARFVKHARNRIGRYNNRPFRRNAKLLRRFRQVRCLTRRRAPDREYRYICIIVRTNSELRLRRICYAHDATIAVSVKSSKRENRTQWIIYANARPFKSHRNSIAVLVCLALSCREA